MPKLRSQSSIKNKGGDKENIREKDEEEPLSERFLKEFQAVLDSRATARAKALEDDCNETKNHCSLITNRFPKNVQDMKMGDFLNTGADMMSAMCSGMNVHAAAIKRKLIDNYGQENNKAVKCPPLTRSEPHEPKRRRGQRLVASAPKGSATTVESKASAKVFSAPASTKASGRVARPATKSTVQSKAIAGTSSAPTRSTHPRSAHTSTKPSEVKGPTKSTVQPRAFAEISSASASAVPPTRPPESSTDVQGIAFSEISSTFNLAVSLPSFSTVIPQDFFFSGPEGQIVKLDNFEALNEMDDSSRNALKEFNRKLSEFLEE